MKTKLKFKGRIIEIPDVEKAEGMKKFTGLMFKSKEANALLFEFDKPRKSPIHSLFCRDFLAVWLDGNKIIEHKFVTKSMLSIKPREKFNKLLEIPINEKYSKIINLFAEEKL